MIDRLEVAEAIAIAVLELREVGGHRAQVREIEALQTVRKARMRDHHRARRRVHHMLEHRTLVGGVERDVDRTEVVDREPGQHHRLAARQPDEHPIALTDALGVQRRGHGAGLRAALGVGERRAVLEPRADAVRVPPRTAVEEVAQHAIFTGGQCGVEPLGAMPGGAQQGIAGLQPLARHQASSCLSSELMSK